MDAKDTLQPLAVVCIPSFRRPEGLRIALQSLVKQQVNFPFAVVVVDNDAAGQDAMRVAGEIFQNGDLQGLVVLEEQQGNVFAINRAFATARHVYPAASYFLMMDDDEEATANWLAEMVSTAQQYKADVVGGPVLRRFALEAPRGVSQHPMFLSLDAESGIIKQIHGSGNCLISAEVFNRLASPVFDTQFNFLGGGDMDFFTRCREAGFKTAWSGKAIIYEDVPASRMEPRWIMERSLRTGIINYNIDKSRRPGLKGTVLLLAKNVISLGLSFLRALKLLARERSYLPATHPILMSVGRILASFGITLTPYKANATKGKKQ